MTHCFQIHIQGIINRKTTVGFEPKAFGVIKGALIHYATHPVGTTKIFKSFLTKQILKIKYLGKKYFIPLQWRCSIPLLLAEFMMIHHLITDIPPEFSGEQVGSELLRRIQAIFNLMQGLENENERVNEDKALSVYTTPYDHMVMPHMTEWNKVLINALKTPGEVDKQLFYSNSTKRVEKDGTVYSHWFAYIPEWRILDGDNNMVALDTSQFECPERFENRVQRESIGQVIKMIYRRISNVTFDFAHMVTNQEYATTLAHRWTYDQVNWKTNKVIKLKYHVQFQAAMKPLSAKRKLGHRRRQMCHPYLLHDDQWGHPDARTRSAQKRPRSGSRHSRFMNHSGNLPSCYVCEDDMEDC